MAKAFIRFKDGTRKTIPYEKGLAIHYVLSGERKPEDVAQAAYAEQVARVFLSYRSAPESYKQAHAVVLNNLEAYQQQTVSRPEGAGSVYDQRYK